MQSAQSYRLGTRSASRRRIKQSRKRGGPTFDLCVPPSLPASLSPLTAGQLPLLSTKELDSSAALLRRAHLVLAFIMHFYIQSLPPDASVVIPRPIALPILHVSACLDIPPLLTYSDTVLYNWVITSPPSSSSPLCPSPSSSSSVTLDHLPTISNIRSKTLFSDLPDEEEFYLCSARIELRGVEALELMRATMDEIFIGDLTAVRRISGYLNTMSTVIDDLRTLLMDVRNGCRPNPYYNEVRPWFRGQDSDDNGRKWVFEGVEEEEEGVRVPMELSGPSAGQSSIVHVLDVFLGVDHQGGSRQQHQQPQPPPVASTSSAPSSLLFPPPSLSSTGPPLPRPPLVSTSQSAPAGPVKDRPSFMCRMQTYMPHNHRAFLDHLSANSRPLRTFVAASGDPELLDSFNKAVKSLKEFRDAHMIIATLYILGPARKAAKMKAELKVREREKLAAREAVAVLGKGIWVGGGGSGSGREVPRTPLKGTGGTDLVRFLKDTRNRTSETMLR